MVKEGKTCKRKSYPGFSIEYMNFEEAAVAEKHWTNRKRKSSSEEKINLGTIICFSHAIPNWRFRSSAIFDPWRQ